MDVVDPVDAIITVGGDGTVSEVILLLVSLQPCAGVSLLNRLMVIETYKSTSSSNNNPSHYTAPFQQTLDDLLAETVKRLNPQYQHCLPDVPCAGSGVVRIDPLRFLAGCRTRRLNQV